MSKEFKIVCNKQDFATLISACTMKPGCYGCVLETICDVSGDCERPAAAARLAEICEIAQAKEKSNETAESEE